MDKTGEENKENHGKMNGDSSETLNPFIATNLTKIDTSSKVRKSKKKGLFLSYAPNAPYEERKFVIELAKQLNEIGMHDDVWFDRDVLQNGITGPFLISSRLEVAEKCKGAIIVLSETYFLSPQTRSEAEIFLRRTGKLSMTTGGVQTPELLIVKLSEWDEAIDLGFSELKQHISVNLSVGKISRLSEAEKVSMFISVLNKKLEEIANGFTIKVPKTIQDFDTLIQYRTKPMLSWTIKDVQDWLASLKIHEKYIISFEEFEIDGFLLQALTGGILSNVLAVDSQICRRKILQKIKFITDEEIQTGRFDEWSKYKSVRMKANNVYLIHDPEDDQLGNLMRHDFEEKKLKISSHSKLGQSKDEFLRSNAHDIASSSYVIFLLTSRGATSPFSFYELVFSIWLGRPLIVAVFEDCFDCMRLSLSATLSEIPAIDFSSALYLDSLDLLVNEIKPPRAVSGVVYEQRYLKHVAEGVCQFREIADKLRSAKVTPEESAIPASVNLGHTPVSSRKLFVSYLWDHQSKVKTLMKNLKSANFTCWSDMDHVTRRPMTQSMPRMTPLGTSRMSAQDNLANEIEKHIKNSCAVVICVSPSYLQNSNCLKEVSIAAYYKKPIIAVLLQWLSWPPDSVAYSLRRIFATVKCIDLSNDKLFAKNLPSLTSYLSRAVLL